MMTRFSDLPEKTLLRPDEVAVFLSVSVKTVYWWVENGTLKGTKMAGRSLRIYRESVVCLVNRNTTA